MSLITSSFLAFSFSAFSIKSLNISFSSDSFSWTWYCFKRSSFNFKVSVSALMADLLLLISHSKSLNWFNSFCFFCWISWARAISLFNFSFSSSFFRSLSWSSLIECLISIWSLSVNGRLHSAQTGPNFNKVSIFSDIVFFHS